METLSKKLEQQPIKAALQRGLGASACSGCPLMKLGCPGKAEAVQDCPPQAEKIRQSEVTKAIVDDDSATSVYADAGGITYCPTRRVNCRRPLLRLNKHLLKSRQNQLLSQRLSCLSAKRCQIAQVCWRCWASSLHHCY